MNRLVTSKLKTFIIVGFAALAIVGCKKDNPDGEIASCEGCHTNYAHLQEVYSPDTAAPAGGCGGDAPHFEPYDRVFMGGDGFEVLPAWGDPSTCYAMSQQGNIRRLNLETGGSVDIKPAKADDVDLRFHWNSAIAQDPFPVPRGSFLPFHATN